MKHGNTGLTCMQIKNKPIKGKCLCTSVTTDVAEKLRKFRAKHFRFHAFVNSHAANADRSLSFLVWQKSEEKMIN